MKRAEAFLTSLLSPKQTPRVPRKLRLMAKDILRHFPSASAVDDRFSVPRTYRASEAYLQTEGGLPEEGPGL